MGGGQVKTPARGQAQPGQEGRYATAAGTPRIAQSTGERHMGADHRETADGYAGELFRSGRYRVAVCRDGLQWLFQRQRLAHAPVGTAWDTLGYCVTREALMRLHRAHTGTDAPELAALPERFKRKGGTA